MWRPRAVFAFAAALNTASAIRVDDDEGVQEASGRAEEEAEQQDQDQDQDLKLKISLADRAGAGAAAGSGNKALLQRLMDSTLERKISAAEKENYIKTIRAHEAGDRASAAAKALEREELMIKQGEIIESNKVTASKSAQAKATEGVGREKAEVTAANKAAKVAESPGAKRQAEEEAAFAGAKLRKAQGELSLAKLSFQRADEESKKMSEETDSVQSLKNMKNDESIKQYSAADLGSDRQKAEATATEKKYEFFAARRAYDLDEAAELRALSAHNKPDADAAALQAKKEREELDASAAARKKAQDTALELETKMMTSSEEAQKLGESAVVDAAKNKEAKADREAQMQISIAKSQKLRMQEETKRSEEAEAVHKKAEADAAAAEARHAKLAYKAASGAAEKMSEEVKFRQSASVAAKARLGAEKQSMLMSNDKLAAEQASGREAAALRLAVLDHNLPLAKKQANAVKVANDKVKVATKAKYKAEQEASSQDAKEQQDIKSAEEMEGEADDILKAAKRGPCADEHGLCMCKGTVVYGRKYVDGKAGKVRTFEQALANRIRQKPSSWGLLCSNIVFGDPAAGLDKQCFCKDTVSVIISERKAFRALQEAEAALAKVSLVRKAFHREQATVEDAVEIGERDAERAVERAYSQSFMSEKRIQKAENEALRVSVENGGGEDAMDAIAVHDLMKARGQN